LKQVVNLLDEIQKTDRVRIHPEIAPLLRLSEEALRSVRALLPSLPNPQQAAHFLKRLLTESPQGADAIAADLKALRYTLTVFSYSQFLSGVLIRRPEWILDIARSDDLHRGFLREEYEAALEAALPTDGEPQAVDFALFRRRQILRIVLRDTLRHADVSETAEDLSNLADAILNVAWRTVRREIAASHGDIPNAFSVIALGKLGGRELNYSSDIDLLFVFDPAPASETVPEFFRAAARRLTELLSTYSAEGMCYRVDLRLRPDGSLGEICQPLDAAKKYYEGRARDWELQMLIKARVAAGDLGPGRDLLEFVEPLIYRTTTDFRMIEAVSETRARIHEKQARKKRTTGLDVKLARGGIRDIEFLVQCLQRLHGGREPWVRHGGTLLALSRLRDKELLSSSEYSRLASAYQFLRHLEHRLQFDEDRQTHSLPLDAEALDSLARKMPLGLPGLPRASSLERALDRHFQNVQNLYDRVIGLQRPPLPATEPVIAEPPENFSSAAEPGDAPARPDFPSVNLARYLDLLAPRFSRLLASSPIRRGQESMESFLEKVVAEPQWLRMLDSNEELSRCTIDVLEHSQYFADQLVRRPELLTEVEQACSIRQGRTGFVAPRDPVDLRRFFREQMVRIQSDSVYHRVPVFRTLKRTSDLAEALIEAAYEVAVTEALETTTPPAGYTPEKQMVVVGLGRLGLREFDLASDADLVFMLPDEDAPAMEFWTAVAENIIRIIGAYTGDGVIFNIDARLRPHGREGSLVQTAGAFEEYFERHAEAWEGISYMKARAVAGNIEKGTAFLNQLQQLDWRRYGQNGRSRTELALMRAKIEREQGGSNPLKAGPGGYYDIDFALMYLRLRGAGLFYKSLNTPARIEVIERMGHLDRDDVEMLTHAATFYRAVDHGIRVSTGQADGRLPANPAQVAILTELVGRWTPHGFLDGPLESVAKRVRRDTRAFFVRIFGPISES
jgi:glutamate-ammonia-ligase adenylyltransferase